MATEEAVWMKSETFLPYNEKKSTCHDSISENILLITFRKLLFGQHTGDGATLGCQCLWHVIGRDWESNHPPSGLKKIVLPLLHTAALICSKYRCNDVM